MIPASEQIDTHVQIITPENIAFQYQVAGPFLRLPAFLIDLSIQTLLCALAVMSFGMLFGLAALPGLGIGTAIIFFFAVSWFYGGLFETFWNGQTPGKYLLRLQVVSSNGQPINALQAVLRNILRSVDGLPGLALLQLYLLGFLTSASNQRFARLGDLACGTMVVVVEPKHRYGVTRLADPRVWALAAELPAGLRVSPSMALCLSSYVMRRRSLPWDMVMTLAEVLAQPLRRAWDLSPQINGDLLLCALYHRTFFADESDESRVAAGPAAAELA